MPASSRPGDGVGGVGGPSGEASRERKWRLLTALLFILVALRLFTQAVVLPVFEGPDEPFHLARAQLLARGDLAGFWRGEHLPPDLVEAVATYPCAQDLHRVFGCPLFSELSPSALANSLRRAPARRLDPPPSPYGYPNYEAHQPLLGYALLALPVAVYERLESSRTPAAIARELLILRLAAALAVVAALLLPLRSLALGWRPVSRCLGLAVLLFPGAAESLARVALEPLVFLWAAIFLVEVERDRTRSRTLLLALAAAGPFLKLTALPVVLYGAVRLWSGGRRGLAAAVATSPAMAIATQVARGWVLGGALDFHLESAALAGGGSEGVLPGLLRSAVVFGKTAFWLGGWSSLRPPISLLLGLAVTGLIGAACVRWRPGPGSGAALASACVAAAGWLGFALAHHRLFGVWGAVGGWYLWSWAPWLAEGAGALFEWRNRGPALSTACATVLALMANAAWLQTVGRAYGS